MVKIIVIIRDDCIACNIVKKVISQAINNIDTEITLNITKNGERHNPKVYPTTIFEKNNKEIARLEGSFPIDYLNRVIDKLKLEYNG